MDEEKIRKRGDHLKKGEVKTQIIELILDNRGNVLEPYIRKSLEDSQIVYDQSNINRHLNELLKLGCLEKTQSDIPKHPNKWNVKNTKNIMRIKKNFRDIKLNSYGKSLDIVFAKSGYNINSLPGLRLYILLLLSPSFFNTCAEFGIEKLKSGAWKLYLDEEGFTDNQSIIKDLMDCFNWIKVHSDSEMSSESFLRKMEEIVAENSMFVSESEFYKLFEKKFPELVTFAHYKEVWEFYWALMMYFIIFGCFLRMHEQQFEFQDLCFGLLFNLFYRLDKTVGNATPEEIKFAKGIKENVNSYWSSSAPINDKKNELIKRDLYLASEVMLQKKLPQIFDPEMYNNREDIYKALIEYFKPYFEDIPEKVCKSTKINYEKYHKNNPEDIYKALSKIVLSGLYY